MRSNHERLRLKCIESRGIRVEELLAIIFNKFVTRFVPNVRFPVNTALGDALSDDSDSDDGWLKRSNSEY